MGPDAGECIGIALGINTTLKSLKISENLLKTEGSISIIKNSYKLHTLHIAKFLPRRHNSRRNQMKSEAAKELANLLKGSDKLQKLSVDFNEVGPAGTKILMRVL